MNFQVFWVYLDTQNHFRIRYVEDIKIEQLLRNIFHQPTNISVIRTLWYVSAFYLNCLLIFRYTT